MSQTATDLLHNRIKVLDGFRGLAILLVIGYHYLDFFSFGWTGVDLFFVLSGFLITGKLVESMGSAHYFRTFYIKRVLRIMPLYYFMLLMFFVLIPFLLPSYVSVSFKELLQQQIFYWAFVINIYDAVHGWPLNVTLIHFWSLACEMQFYLLWPFIIYFFYNQGRVLKIILVSFCIAGLLFRMDGQLFLPLNDIYRYVLLPCRIDAFSAGALLYLFLREDKVTAYKTRLLLIALMALSVVLVLMLTKQTAWHYSVDVVSKYGFTLDAIFWATLMGFFLSVDRHFIKRIFSGRLMTSLGKYSYGMYVFHWPLYIIISKQYIFNAGTRDKTWELAAVAFAATYLCGFASYHLLEKHFLKLKQAR
ncbi:MAG TPA: acyltransferase [Puia sp.]|nr:acyltransferase [Puia sp.]